MSIHSVQLRKGMGKAPEKQCFVVFSYCTRTIVCFATYTGTYQLKPKIYMLHETKTFHAVEWDQIKEW